MAHRNHIARRVVFIITERGGRFLQKIPPASATKTTKDNLDETFNGDRSLQDTEDLYVLVDERRAIEKTKQCFRHHSNIMGCAARNDALQSDNKRSTRNLHQRLVGKPSGQY